MDNTFCNLSFGLAPGVVVTPRPTSERLVAEALAHIAGRPACVADVGTGSGADAAHAA
ncbi:MAG: hypothetical protein M3540_09845 [Actinomycetota bacterium]|nr:hypothetical protein [Actinomycetota bacterium]